MSQIEIWVATQALPAFSLKKFYKPIFVGAENSPPEAYRAFQYYDNIGISISKENAKYCELTALFWAWKNAPPLGIVGLCHYRRFFLFATKRFFNIDVLPFNDKDLLVKESLNSIPENLMNFVQDGGWITAPRRYLDNTIYNYYIEDPVCYKGDFDTMVNVLLEKYPEYADSINSFLTLRSLNHFNMFIARSDDFDKYCSWLFDILSAVDARLDYSQRNKQQMRVLGFLGERLLGLYIYHNKLLTKEILVAYYNPKHRLFNFYRGNNIWLRQLTYKVLTFLQSLARMAKIGALLNP